MKLLLFSIFALANVWAMPPKNPVIPIRETIEILNEENLACSADSDCRYFAFGNKACGGPATYIITSTVNQHFTEIRSLAALSEVLGFRYNRDNGGFSNCRPVPPPNMECSENKCVITGPWEYLSEEQRREYLSKE